jgi:tripartite-type tricarboxylate transporter receptor subunit TctC
MLRHDHSRRLLLALGAAAVPRVLGAQTPEAGYPARPIQLVVGFAPGGGTDVMARIVARRLEEAWGRGAVVVNRPGAGGNIGTQAVATAAPDGHTLLVAVSSLALNVGLYRNLPFDTLRDLAPVAPLSVSANMIAAHPSLPARSLQDVIALARARPGQVSYASPGNGQASHLAMELLARLAGVSFLHVPFNGGGPSVSAALAGTTNLLVGALPTVLPPTRNGQLRALAVTTARRITLAPDIPTVAEETGLADYDANVWYGILAPAGTPPAIVAKINEEIGRILRLPETREQFATLGFEPWHGTPGQFGELIRGDIAKWSEVIRAAGIQLD